MLWRNILSLFTRLRWVRLRWKWMENTGQREQWQTSKRDRASSYEPQALKRTTTPGKQEWGQNYKTTGGPKKVNYILWHGEWKRQPMLGNGTINGDTIGHTAQRNQWKYCWEGCFLCGLCQQLHCATTEELLQAVFCWVHSKAISCRPKG
jgi:hypothetical protein